MSDGKGGLGCDEGESHENYPRKVVGDQSYRMSGCLVIMYKEEIKKDI